MAKATRKKGGGRTRAGTVGKSRAKTRRKAPATGAGGARKGAGTSAGRASRTATKPVSKATAKSAGKTARKDRTSTGTTRTASKGRTKTARKAAANTGASGGTAAQTAAAQAGATRAATRKSAARAAGQTLERGTAKPASAPVSRRAGAGRSRAPSVQHGGTAIGAVLRRAARTVGRAARRLVGATGAPPAKIADAASRAAPMVAPAGVAVTGRMRPRYAEVLTAEALAFLAELHRKFDGRRKDLLAARAAQQARYDAGALPDFLAGTQALRDGAWTVAPIPADLLDRRVEITGPVDRKMIVNALNSGADVFMADFEDANAPTWPNNMEGQLNLKDRWDGKLDFVEARTGRRYRLGEEVAVLIVRPRGWHLPEVHLTVDGEPISGTLFDFGLYAFHNARAAIAQGSGPYFYLPKLETHQEARLWNEVFIHTQERLGLPNGTIKATVLIETLPAAFEMDEILWELRDHVAGLNAGRWDYIFSFIKTFAKNPDFVLPDRRQVVMGRAFLGAYAALLVKTCHRRGAFAMGGMAAQIPVKDDPEANETAFALVRADKERELRDGHDGTWVAHPGLVPVAAEVFGRLPGPNQLGVARDDVQVTRDDLLRIHEGTKTEEGFRLNIRVGVQCIAAWLAGRGAVPIYNLMEDAATAEISRAQIWQWLTYKAVLDTGAEVTPEFFRRAMQEELEQVEREVGGANFRRGRFREAAELFERLSLAETFEPFLTIPAYELIA